MPHKVAIKKTQHLWNALKSDPGTLAILVTCLVVFSMFAYGTYARFQLANETHGALCQFKNSIIEDRDNGLEFLKLSPEERAKKYGPAFANIPASTIQQNVDAQTKRIAALRTLDCPQPE
jgi:hypothetical protein